MKELKEQFERDRRFEFIAKLHKEFPKATVFLVGGAVRDFLKAKSYKLKAIKPEDNDFVVEGIDKGKLEKFLGSQGTVKDVESRSFGVFKFIPKKLKSYKLKPEIDIAVPRTDRWTGEGYKDVEVKTEGVDLKDDLSRRDFTINAMALNLRNYEIVDEFNGQEDLEKGIVRAVGNPLERFQEDPSRILRGIRFAITFNFAIEKNTFKAMKDKMDEIREPLRIKSEIRNPKSETNSNLQSPNTKYRVSEEVIAKEFLKAFDKDSVTTIKLYDQVGLLKLLMSEVEAMKKVKQPRKYHAEGDVFEHTLLALKKLEEIRNPKSEIRKKSKLPNYQITKLQSINLKLALLFHDIGKPSTFCPPQFKGDRIHFNEHDEVGAEIAKKIIRRLKLSSMAKGDPLHVDEDIVAWLVKKHMIFVTADPEKMRLIKFEKYFFRDDGASEDLLNLVYLDISATVPPSGKSDFSTYDAFIKKIGEIRDQVQARKEEKKLPPPLVNGNDVIKTLKIKGGPRIGKLLAKLREMQLAGEIKTKEEAIERLKNL